MTIDNDTQLARVMLEHSLLVKAREKVLILVSGQGAEELVRAVFVEALKLGAYPLVDGGGPDLSYQFYKNANPWQLSQAAESVVKAKIAWADAFVRIVAEENSRLVPK